MRPFGPGKAAEQGVGVTGDQIPLWDATAGQPFHKRRYEDLRQGSPADFAPVVYDNPPVSLAGRNRGGPLALQEGSLLAGVIGGASFAGASGQQT